MKKYFSIFKLKLISGMQYRAAAWAGVCTQLFFGFMYIMIYTAFYKSSSQVQPMSLSELVSYMWLQQAFLAIVMLRWQDGELLSQITTGHVAYELCRPYNLFSFWFMRLLAVRLSNVALRCLPVLIISFLLPSPFNMTLPVNWDAGFMFLLSLSLATILIIAISMFIYIITFLTMSHSAARLLIVVAAEFLGGSIIPVPLMPETFQNILNFLPFRYTSDLPFRIYTGNISLNDAVSGIIIQIIWIVGLVTGGSLCFRKITKRIVIQGG